VLDSVQNTSVSSSACSRTLIVSSSDEEARLVKTRVSVRFGLRQRGQEVRQREKKSLGERRGRGDVSPHRICQRIATVLPGSDERSRRSDDILVQEKEREERGEAGG
jgi:hypothetical protein